MIGTWINILELLYSNPNNKKGFSENDWRGAIKALLTKSYDIIELDPTQYALDVVVPSHGLTFPLKNSTTILEDILNNKIDMEDFYEENNFFDIYKNFKKHFTKTIKDYCQEVFDARKVYKNNTNLEIAKRCYELIYDINDNILPEHGFSIRTDEWSHDDIRNNVEKIKNTFRLFILSKQLYIEEVSIGGNFKNINWTNNENDFCDLYNMIYACNDFYYWTEERKWYNICKKTGCNNIEPRTLPPTSTSL